MERIEVSVIICHHKGDLIYKAINSILSSVDVKFEIIVATSVNNLEFPNTKTIYVAGGPAHKRNVATRFAEGELIAFFDDDIEVTPGAIYQMKKALDENNAIGMVFGKLKNMEFRDRFDEAGSFLTWSGFLWARAESGCLDYGQYDSFIPVLAGKSAACMIRRKVFWEVGAFDVSYEILAEETDLSWRVWLYDYKVYYCPKSVTYHAFNTKWKPADMYTPKRVYYNGSRNYLSMLYTNLGKKRWIIPILVQLIVWSSAAIGMFLTGKREAGFYIFKGIYYFLSNIKIIWQKRYKVQRARKISDQELIPIISKSPPAKYYINRFFRYIYTGVHG